MAKREKRKRTDTYWDHTALSNAQYFDHIFKAESPIYRMVVEETNLDYAKKKRNCWRIYSEISGTPVETLRSAKAYRLALDWAIQISPFWTEEAKNQLKAVYGRVKTKRGDHCRHLCGNSWCCNPKHISVGTRVSNEVDKHFHYFLRHKKPEVCESFMDSFADLCETQGVWGYYPFSEEKT